MGTMSGSVTALITDAQPAARRFARRLLETMGATSIWEASDGASAFELYLTHKPEIVVVDLNMCSQSGADLTGRLVLVESDAAAGLLAPPGGADMMCQFLKHGAVVHVMKDLPRHLVTDLIADLLESVSEVPTL
jgi:DNA-binding NarL/FixJ family response regulator